MQTPHIRDSCDTRDSCKVTYLSVLALSLSKESAFKVANRLNILDVNPSGNPEAARNRSASHIPMLKYRLDGYNQP